MTMHSVLCLRWKKFLNISLFLIFSAFQTFAYANPPAQKMCAANLRVLESSIEMAIMDDKLTGLSFSNASECVEKMIADGYLKVLPSSCRGPYIGYDLKPTLLERFTIGLLRRYEPQYSVGIPGAPAKPEYQITKDGKVFCTAHGFVSDIQAKEASLKPLMVKIRETIPEYDLFALILIAGGLFMVLRFRVRR